MRRLNVKVMSLIIILIFCLSPLSAIDLNQDNGTAMDNDNNNTHAIDLNEENETAMDNNNTDVAIEDANVNGTQKEIKLSEDDDDEHEPIDPELNVHVPDINAAEDAIAEITLNRNYSGYADVKLDGVQHQRIYIRNGYAKVYLWDELMPGEHSVEVISQATDDFLEADVKTTFKVSNTPHIYPLTNDILDDEPLYVRIRTHSQYNGLVVCTLEDGSTQYGYAENGIFSCEFNQSECFTPGFHNLHIVVAGDQTFSQSETYYSYHVR